MDKVTYWTGVRRPLVRALVDYAPGAGLRGIEMRLAPAAYMREPHDHLGFALFAEGFHQPRLALVAHGDNGARKHAIVDGRPQFPA